MSFNPTTKQITLRIVDDKSSTCYFCESDVKLCGTCLQPYRVTETPDDSPGCREHECTSCCGNVMHSAFTSGFVSKSPMPFDVCKSCFYRVFSPTITQPCDCGK
uniref:Uncharacterized protein n=1 Tax=Clandestinovirus TaxID=2831644 RepID=A0A8F8PND1_9VIRU|nr:hypothetical protein KOM_12_444 [Clandestinovirus]